MKMTAIWVSAALMISGSLFASESKNYEVTITNLTKGQIFTPVLAATHKSSIAFFELGEPARDELELLAEDGATDPLNDLLLSVPELVQDTSGTGPIMPGASASFMIEGSNRFDRLSFAAMLLPTNDSFVAVNSIPLPRNYSMATAYAYDSGTEYNDELCESIPGPPVAFCQGANVPDDSGEGYVHLSNGVHGVGDTIPMLHDWRGPVARVTIRRVK
jgi:hypothetical protein